LTDFAVFEGKKRDFIRNCVQVSTKKVVKFESRSDSGQPVENFHRLPIGFEIIDGSYPCCADNFDTCLIKAGQQLGARLYVAL
jgi:hypothetical protein